MQQTPQEAYSAQQGETLTGRELEASVLTRAGLMLKQIQDNWDTAERNEKLLEAIRFNQKVWSFFQSELSMPDNPLPQKLREDILNLSLFVDKRLFEVMSNPEKQKLDIIIDINFNIAAGLRAAPQQQ
ncbi:MAG: flagellar biosynthesis regulator FlaF [Geobacter sp.]|nr:flagellar biosynthesis regulator FlaF [Geobacter sp.]